MYEIDELDSLIALKVPFMRAGDPAPEVVADEHSLRLTYWLDDGTDYRDGGAGIKPEQLMIATFQSPRLHYLGPPSEEIMRSHPLYARGLRSYGFFQVFNSSLIRIMERRNSVHERHNPSRYSTLKHYIVSFHDSLFECVADEYKFSISIGEGETMRGRVPALRRPTW